MEYEEAIMKDHIFTGTILALALFILGGQASAATISLDLDSSTPGVQSTHTLSPGSVLEFEVVFTGDGTTQFDTFALDVIYDNPSLYLRGPVAGPIVGSAPLMALDLYGAHPVSSGDVLTQGDLPPPLSFDGGLGGVGVSSVGGMPFSLIGEDETIGLFRASMTAQANGTSNLVLSGFPFGSGTELSLAGESVPVMLQTASVSVVPLPPAVWLFATGILTLLVIGCRKSMRIASYGRVSRRWAFLMLVLVSPLGFAAPDTNADINGDAFVTSQDISKLSSCFGQDPMSNIDCAIADVDGDGDIDVVDFSFVSARLGEAYPWMLYPSPESEVSDSPVSVALGDVNKDGLLDVVAAYRSSNDISVLLAAGEGGFQKEQRFVAGNSPSSLALGDVNGDGWLDVVVANRDSNDISVLLDNGDGNFQEQLRFATVNGPNSVVLGDVNGDSRLDVVVAASIGDISVLLGNGDGNFQPQQNFEVGISIGDYYLRLNFDAVSLGDVNGDGRLDMVALDSIFSDFFVLSGNGDGSFREPQGHSVSYASYLMTLGDVNEDGLLDVVVAGRSQPNRGFVDVSLGNGDGSFQDLQEVHIRRPLNSVALGDVNGDGTLDVVGAGEDLLVLLVNGDGTIQEPRSLAYIEYGLKSVVLGDVDGNGTLDIVGSEKNRSSIKVWLGNGDGNFQGQQYIEIYSNYNSITQGDVNGDGRLDVLTAYSYGGYISVLLSNSDGSFQKPEQIETVINPRSLVLGDVNGDGQLDLIAVNESIGGISLLLGDGDGSFQEPVRFAIGVNIGRPVLGDLNGDDRLDVVAFNLPSNDVLVILGNGDGSFQEPEHLDAIKSGWFRLGDVNGDGWLDLVAFNHAGGDVLVILGNGDGSFRGEERFATGNHSGSLALGDVNGDGRIDVMVGRGLLFGNGDGSFQAIRSFAADNRFSTRALGDVNGDGILDVVGIRRYATGGSSWNPYYGDNSIVLLLGNGDGSFQEEQRFHNDPISNSTSLVDMNGDGRLDVISYYLDLGVSRISVLLNIGNNM